MCNHESFEANVSVQRLVSKKTNFVANVHIKCAQCGMPFMFVGATPGISLSLPTASYDRQQMHLPITPDVSEQYGTTNLLDMHPIDVRGDNIIQHNDSIGDAVKPADVPHDINSPDHVDMGTNGSSVGEASKTTDHTTDQANDEGDSDAIQSR
jgi:hypothetical protein